MSDLIYHCPVYDCDHLNPPCEKNLARIERIKESPAKNGWIIPWSLEKCPECRGKKLEKKKMPFDDTETKLPRTQQAVLEAIVHLGDPTQHEVANYLGKAAPTVNVCIHPLIDAGMIEQAKGSPPYRYRVVGIPSQPEETPIMPPIKLTEQAEVIAPVLKESPAVQAPSDAKPPEPIKVQFFPKHQDLLTIIVKEAEEQERTLPKQIIFMLKAQAMAMGLLDGKP